MLAMVSLDGPWPTLVAGACFRAHDWKARAPAATRSGNPFVIGFAALSRGRMAGLLEHR